MSEFFTEDLRDWSSSISVADDEGVVRNVALCGQQSKNGYRYSEQSLREAATLYENRPVFLDHASDPSKPHNRSARDLAGSIVNPRFEGGRVRGDIRTTATEAGKTFLALASSNNPMVGMSHTVAAEKDRSGQVIEKIHEVVSVDVVVYPATTRNFTEQTNGDDDMSDTSTRLAEKFEADWKTEQAKRIEVENELKTLKSESVPKLQTEISALKEQVASLTTERDEARTKLDEIQTQQAVIQRKESVLESLKANKLNPEDKQLVSDVFMETLMGVEDESKREALIKDRANAVSEALKGNGRQMVLGTERVGGNGFDSMKQLDRLAEYQR